MPKRSRSYLHACSAKPMLDTAHGTNLMHPHTPATLRKGMANQRSVYASPAGARMHHLHGTARKTESHGPHGAGARPVHHGVHLGHDKLQRLGDGLGHRADASCVLMSGARAGQVGKHSAATAPAMCRRLGEPLSPGAQSACTVARRNQGVGQELQVCSCLSLPSRHRILDGILQIRHIWEPIAACKLPVQRRCHHSPPAALIGQGTKHKDRGRTRQLVASWKVRS